MKWPITVQRLKFEVFLSKIYLTLYYLRFQSGIEEFADWTRISRLRRGESGPKRCRFRGHILAPKHRWFITASRFHKYFAPRNNVRVSPWRRDSPIDRFLRLSPRIQGGSGGFGRRCRKLRRPVEAGDDVAVAGSLAVSLLFSRSVLLRYMRIAWTDWSGLFWLQPNNVSDFTRWFWILLLKLKTYYLRFPSQSYLL